MRPLPVAQAVLVMSAAEVMPPMPVAPDAAMVAAYADMVFGWCEGWVAVRALAEKGGPDRAPHTPFLPADAELPAKLAIQAQWAAAAGMALYVIPGTVPEPGQASAEHIAQMQVVLVDLDGGDIAAKRAHLLQHLGPPSLEVASGGVTPEGQAKLHLYWRLTEPATGEDLAKVCRLRHAIAVKVGGDPAFRSAHQPIRVAGSVHAKTGQQRLVAIRHRDGHDQDLTELAEAVLAMPPLPGVGVEAAVDAAGNPLDFNGAGSSRGDVTELFGQQVREGGADGVTRFEALSRIIGYWIRRCQDGFVTAAQAWQEICDYNTARITPPWPEDRLRHEAERLWRRAEASHAGAGAADPEHGEVGGDGTGDDGVLPIGFTEDALAAEFSEQHGEDWRHVSVWGAWLTWTGSRWEREGTLRAFDLARLVCRAAANRANSNKVRTKLSQASTVAAVERLARADRRHATTAEVWDRDPWLLNTPAGVVDLRTGALAPHDRALCMTKITSAAPQGECAAWVAFLAQVTGGDVELQAYLRRVVGYALTGVTTEHALFFLYGTGANGKSVFANTLTALLGDYATVAPMDMFMATTGDRHPTDMAGLRGARIVTSIETEQGSRWAESKLKALTGGDRITARFMRQDFFEFTPQFKLLVAGNHKPSIRNVDEAMRRRLHMVPFTVTIPPAQRDKRLPERLLAERDGILAWALQGCLEWQRVGLRPPATVLAATEEYFEAEDALGRWLAECCERGVNHVEATAVLFASWKAWAEAGGEYVGSVRRFSDNLLNRGFELHRKGSARQLRGLRLCQSTAPAGAIQF
ncbi:phage/plasmid primase, P4 family [Neoroseomonas eburnea]|nr:phage/plasmid primase, P4 family [Neoroseomonas eburnea]